MMIVLLLLELFDLSRKKLVMAEQKV